MKKLVIGIALISILSSCKDSKETKIEKTIKVGEKEVVKDSVQEKEIVSDEEFKNDFDILLPRSYRSYIGERPGIDLTEKWIDLHEQNGEYYLGKADFKIEKGFDECSGDSLISIIPKKKSIVFMDYPSLKLGKIKSLKIEEDKIWPDEKMTLAFNNVNYTLRAEGKVLSSEMVSTDDNTEEVFKKVENYKLYLTTGNTTEKLLLAEQSFNDTFVELLFAGDIDNDGKLDFIFSANRHYEEERVILFLSSKAKDGEAMKRVSEIAVGFDC
ncbi:hypothetical protein [Flavobacterium hydatis]|uniref:Lipoprotein n=1 Tax=Flavobacterium hydatis TaxID=991 RepID=A0A086AGX3_FLAHY|nr:hypothetical protein [Flavobacterium hydatis]KFF15937.1 hypothetical protein IW20_12560 [Flavobacterium hydatis]OXA88870.1 hypothetical protein B0A62_21800 [Flavobacterium hydatis]